jgi:hypothetical protein
MELVRRLLVGILCSSPGQRRLQFASGPPLIHSVPKGTGIPTIQQPSRVPLMPWFQLEADQ